MRDWTDKQKETIELRGKNILVSAAAGSGKTAVLIERIMQLIIRDQVPVDRFLITTFTNAAAAEMKQRLDDAIRNRLSDPDIDDKEKIYLRQQIRLLPRANISTFHSFTIEVMRRYFYLTDLEPGVVIGDETQMEILKRDSIDEVFDKRFNDDESYGVFSKWLNKYSRDKNEKELKDSIISLYNSMRSIPNYMEWAGERIALMYNESPVKAYGLDKFVEEETNRILDAAVSRYGRGVEMLHEYGLEELAKKAEGNVEIMKSISRKVAEEGTIPTVKYNTISATKDEKEQYEEIKATVKEYFDSAKKMIDDLKKKYYAISIKEMDDDLKSQADDTSYLLEIVRDFESVYKAKKAELTVVDFDDVLHTAIDILHDETAQQEYRDKFEYIFVDEYQDSNKLQEEIVGLISRENNLFMVGDIKQSIYKFRLAEPELFRDRYKRYAQGDQKTSVKIDLNMNFRSKASVIDTVNDVFMPIMEDYDEDAKLHLAPVNEDDPGMSTELHIVNKANYDGDKDDIADSEFKIIMREIDRHIGQEIYNPFSGQYRKVSLRDIVVLTRGNDTIAKLEKFLNNNGIPAYGESSGGYFDTVEIKVFTDILRTINNTRQDVPLIATMRSVAFNFTPTELAQIRIEYPAGAFYSAINRYAKDGSNQAIREKISSMLEKIRYWKQLKSTISLEELIKTVLEDTGYYDYCNGLPAGRQRVSNLRLLIEKAAEFEERNYSGLHGFLSYIEAMKNRNINVAEAKTIGEGEEVVRIMTIHKSKGLEFPIVIVAGCGKQLFSNRRGGSLIKMHQKFSIALPKVNREQGWHRKTLLQTVIDSYKRQEEEAEEVRVLYVALTRAKDKLILIGSVNNSEKSLNEDEASKTSYINMVYPALAGKNMVTIEEAGVLAESIDADVMPVKKPDLITASSLRRDEDRIREFGEILTYKYRDDDIMVKSKYSVSQLNHMDSVAQRPQLVKNLFDQTSRTLNAAEIGTAMHAVMERIDFAKALSGGREYIGAFADELVADGILTPQERDVIDVSNIFSFFETEVGMRASKSDELYKEREFILCKDIQGISTIVQGIIDCYFIEPDGIVLIDYKNSFVGGSVTEEEIADRYREQISLYKEALSEATGLTVKESYLYLFNLQKFITV